MGGEDNTRRPCEGGRAENLIPKERSCESWDVPLRMCLCLMADRQPLFLLRLRICGEKFPDSRRPQDCSGYRPHELTL